MSTLRRIEDDALILQPRQREERIEQRINKYAAMGHYDRVEINVPETETEDAQED